MSYQHQTTVVPYRGDYGKGWASGSPSNAFFNRRGNRCYRRDVLRKDLNDRVEESIEEEELANAQPEPEDSFEETYKLYEEQTWMAFRLRERGSTIEFPQDPQLWSWLRDHELEDDRHFPHFRALDELARLEAYDAS